ncbi:hypothetical protein BG006_006456 [Podila minutissima]|uniref:Peptidase S8/S53 domain-containing protein n=1 Tax=Podila minutissima TaxID=64525 RepID=A0A9P5SL36_9FUNG|nr:hypothetical protein BG006_006456 [Podila minutissima]
MKPQLILLLSLALVSIAVAHKPSHQGQNVLVVPNADTPVVCSAAPSTTQDDEEDPSLAYVYDPSKALTRGYDFDGRQEVVNIGPGLRTTADGQTQSRRGPRGRQRGAVLPNKYIVRLKNGYDLDTFNMQSKLEEHDRVVNTLGSDGRRKVETITNQVDHKYDFGTWKGYAGQFSSEFLKELESHDEVEYVEEDTLMWAWGMEPMFRAGDDQDDDDLGRHQDSVNIQQQQQQQNQQEDNLAALFEEALNAVQPGSASSAKISTKKGSRYGEDIVVNGHDAHHDYYSIKAPSWGLSRIAERERDLDQDYTYVSSAGSGVDVYIVDSGVFAEHDDFEGRAENVANFVNHETATDTCGHGTHVAGIVGGRRFGVAKGVHINAVKVLDAQGQGSTSQVLAGINFVIKHASSNPHTRKIINMSLGGLFSRPVNDAVRVAVNRYNLPFFVAAGNTGDDACQYSPAGVDEAFAVGGSDRSDMVGWYSCVGSCVNIFAPGSGIQSNWIRSRNSVHMLDGTSMAAPHVTGVAALFLGSGANYGNVKDLYNDIIAHATQGVIQGLKSHDTKTSKNLLYNKLEDLNSSFTIRPMDGVLLPMDEDVAGGNDGGQDEEKAQDVKKKAQDVKKKAKKVKKSKEEKKEKEREKRRHN